MTQHRQIIPTFPELPPMPDATPEQRAALHLDRARALRIAAAHRRRTLLQRTQELGAVIAEWYDVRRPYIERQEAQGEAQGEEEAATGAALDRLPVLEDRMTALDSELTAGREELAAIEREAQGHELAAVYEDASTEGAALASAGDTSAILAQLASEREELALTLHARGADIEEDMTAAAGELAGAVAEWGALLALPRLTEAQGARSSELAEIITDLSRRIERERERWRQIEQDAQAHTLTAAYLRARPAYRVPTP